MRFHEALQILGLSEGADADAIRRAYRRTARATHPDRFPEGSHQKLVAEEEMKVVNEAYRVLRTGAWDDESAEEHGDTKDAWTGEEDDDEEEEEESNQPGAMDGCLRDFLIWAAFLVVVNTLADCGSSKRDVIQWPRDRGATEIWQHLEKPILPPPRVGEEGVDSGHQAWPR